MTTPDQPRTEHEGRSGGVRGAINDLLGRGDDDHDDRRAEDERRAQERPATGTAEPGTTTRPADDGYAADDGYGTPAGQSGSTVGAAAPQGEPFDDPAGATVPGAARHQDVGPDGPGYDQPVGGSVPTQRQDTGRHDMGSQDMGSQDMGSGTGQYQGGQQATGAQPGYEGQPGYAEEPGYGEQPGYEDRHGDTGSAGTHTVDVGEPAGGTSAGDDLARPVPADAGSNGAVSSSTASGGAAAATSSTQQSGGTGVPAQGEDSEGRERLVSADRAESYGSRWDTVKGEFVDEPRKAVADADALVGELLDELQTLFTEQRHSIERNLDADETSTEDMRLALRRYRSFFDRLLSI